MSILEQNFAYLSSVFGVRGSSPGEGTRVLSVDDLKCGQLVLVSLQRFNGRSRSNQAFVGKCTPDAIDLTFFGESVPTTYKAADLNQLGTDTCFQLWYLNKP